MKRVFSLILLLSSAFLASSTSISQHQVDELRMEEADEIIASLQAQVQTLLPTELLGSAAAANARRVCGADYLTFCKQNVNKNSPISHSDHQMHQHEMHQHEMHGRLLSDEKQPHPKCHHGPLLVFGSFENDRCMISNFNQLSTECQEAINNQFELNEQKNMEFSNENNGVHGGVVILLIVVLASVCICKRRRHHLKMKKFADVIYDNPEVRSVLEGIAGEQLPPRPRCCQLTETKKRCIRMMLCLTLSCFGLLALIFSLAGIPIVGGLKIILSSLFAIFASIFLLCLIKRFLSCCCRFCCSNSSSSSNSCPRSNNQHQYSPCMTRSIKSDIVAAAENMRNGNIQMVYSGLPVPPPTQFSS